MITKCLPYLMKCLRSCIDGAENHWPSIFADCIEAINPHLNHCTPGLALDPVYRIREQQVLMQVMRFPAAAVASRAVFHTALTTWGVPAPFRFEREATMPELLIDAMSMVLQTAEKVLPVTIVLALVFTVLGHFWACNPGTPWWRRREIVTDTVYWFLVPVFIRSLRIGLMIVGAELVFNIHGASALIAFYDHGHGPLSELPLWIQALLYLVASDFMLYWLHRMFHGGRMWKYHAVHHSTKEVEWISAARFHPVNLVLGTIIVDVILLLAGISPDIMIWVGPFNSFHSAFVHANLKWTLGPFKYVLATPVFHRWHHTAIKEGGSTNFAGTFPLWDILFGTFRMPEGRLPEGYGVDEPAMPSEFIGQIAFPFRRYAREAASAQ